MVKVLMATSEAAPMARTGGLGDVCGALPLALRRLGQPVSLIMPAYRGVFQCGLPLNETGLSFEVAIGTTSVSGRLLTSHLPPDNVPLYLVAQDDYFDRDSLYGAQEDFRDNCERFVFFCRAVFESIRLLDLDVDLIHCNDWQTSLIPIYLRTEYSESSRYEHLATLLTIHNLAYQGRFWHWDMLLTGLDWKYFNWRQLEFFGELNLLKGGIVFADAINTVSPKYAEEIQRAPLGCGLEGALHQRRHVLSGILNGIDDTNWNPACDPHVLPPYSTPDWKQGKAAAKVRLQQEFNLAAAPRAPLVGLVGRLTEQKGMDLALTLIEHWARSRDVQWVVLGSGQADYEQELRQLAVTYPDRVVVRVEFNGPLAHRIMAAADLFLMPSRFEPCGLSQMYAMRYGAVPVVHDTGGLHDTVHNLTSASRLNGTANGFAFERFDLMSCDEALSRACDVYRHEPKVWEQLVVAGMSHDWSWRRSAEQYVQLYQQTVARARQTICA